MPPGVLHLDLHVVNSREQIAQVCKFAPFFAELGDFECYGDFSPIDLARTRREAYLHASLRIELATPMEGWDRQVSEVE